MIVWYIQRGTRRRVSRLVDDRGSSSTWRPTWTRTFVWRWGDSRKLRLPFVKQWTKPFTGMPFTAWMRSEDHLMAVYGDNEHWWVVARVPAGVDAMGCPRGWPRSGNHDDETRRAAPGALT